MVTESHERRFQQPASEHRVSRTRNRIPLSCVACRIRKLKCNREKPCQNCMVRGDTVAAACSYAKAAQPKSAGAKGIKSSPVDTRARIDRLEILVRSLISQEYSGKSYEGTESKEKEKFPSSSSDGLLLRTKKSPSRDDLSPDDVDGADETSCPPGGQKISIDTRSTHWDAILHDITAIKDAWTEHDDTEKHGLHHAAHNHRPGLLNGLIRPPDFQSLIASIPPKATADKLLDRFFDSYNPAIPAKFLIHKPTFINQYDEYWRNPTKAKVIWVGLLFGILCFAMQSYIGADEEPPEYEGTSKVLFDLYRIRTAQCIVAADITRPTDFMIETMLLYAMVEYYDQRDGEMGVWIISGTIMRLALQQGYHRDPSQHPDISPFQAEMRRRLWMLVTQHEVIFSVQLGLPKMIRYAECDTATPLNIYEEELHVDMKVPPSGRPLTEPTPISYQITKSRIMRAYGHVIEHIHVLDDHPYEEVMKLDARLIDSRALIPPHLLLALNEGNPNEAAGLIMERYVLQHFYHKAVCVLHRKYLTSFPADNTHAYSRRTCIISALDLLGQQVSLHAECQPGGRLRRIKWYHFSLVKHDFLLAAMILCLALYNNKRQKTPDGTGLIGEISVCQRIEIKSALHGARRIWADIADEDADARRAISILNIVLAKLGMSSMKTGQDKEDSPMEDLGQTAVAVPENVQSSNFAAAAQSKPLDPVIDTQPSGSWDTSAYSASLNSMNGASPVSYYENELIHDNLFSSGGIFNSFQTDLKLPADLDWAAWDLYINGPNRTDISTGESWPIESSLQTSLGMTPYQTDSNWS